MLTREELDAIRRGVPPAHCEADSYAGRLFVFAEEMLPLRDALRELMATRAKMGADMSDETASAYIRASSAFWKLVNEWAETDRQ